VRLGPSGTPLIDTSMLSPTDAVSPTSVRSQITWLGSADRGTGPETSSPGKA
jgi:hypothetical protein